MHFQSAMHRRRRALWWDESDEKCGDWMRAQRSTWSAESEHNLRYQKDASHYRRSADIKQKRSRWSNIVDIDWKLGKWARAQHMSLRADIYRSEQVIASLDIKMKCGKWARAWWICKKEERAVSMSMDIKKKHGKGAEAWILKRSAVNDHERWY